MSSISGVAIRDAAHQAGYHRDRQVAEALGVSPSRYSNWLCGIAEPSAYYLRRIAELCGVAMEDLCFPMPV